LALQAVGRSGADETQALDDHLASCSDDSVPDPVPEALPSAYPVRRRRRTRVLVAGAAAAAAIVVLVALAVATHGGPVAPTTTVALVGQPGVRATVALSAQGGGTAATLDVAGEPAGRVFSVTMRSGAGGWWVAGSYRTTGGPGAQVVHLSCGLAPDRITGVWVSDQTGRVVLSGAVG
jgi:hypothetical protein